MAKTATDKWRFSALIVLILIVIVAIVHDYSSLLPLLSEVAGEIPATSHPTSKKWFDREPLPSSCTKVAFDVGANNGKDTFFLLKKGFCVIAIDANPAMIEEAENLLRKNNLLDPNKVILLPMAIDDNDDPNDDEVKQLPFYVTETKVHSSFEWDKARFHDNNPKTIYVDIYPCEAIFSLVPPNVRPEFMKVDIEERHFACIESLARLKEEQLPIYISWEMHEYARGLPYPILDVQLLLKSYQLGYKGMKIVSNRDKQPGETFTGHGMKLKNHGDYSSSRTPEELVDKFTNSSDWVDVTKGLERGVQDARRYRGDWRGDWWDYYMKLDLSSPAAASADATKSE